MPKLFNNVDTFVPDKLIAGSDIPLLVKAVKLKAGQGVVKRGTVLGNIGLALGAVTKTLTNTGDATIATATTALAKGVQVGTYALQCITGPTKPLELSEIAAGTNAGDAEIDDADLGDNVQVGTYTISCITGPTKPLEVGAITPGTNDGDAEIATATLAPGAQLGDYTIRCITAPTVASANDAVFSVYAPDGSRLADATQGVAYAGGHLVFTIANATAADSEVDDTYTIAVTAGAGANNAVFSVHAPDGSRLADATQGVEYAGHLIFTIGDADTEDTEIGDSYTITVTAGAGANNAVFSVHAPGGSRLADATQGVAYAAGHLVFTVGNATAVDSIVGDSFTIAVAAGSGLAVKVDIAKFDGSGVADGILAVDTDTGGIGATADVYAEAYKTGHFNRKALIVSTGDNITNHEARLRELGILLSDNIPY